MTEWIGNLASTTVFALAGTVFALGVWCGFVSCVLFVLGPTVDDMAKWVKKR